MNNNPFFKDFDLPFDTTPFNEIKTEHFMPAIEHGIKIGKKNIDKIIIILPWLIPSQS